MVFPHTYRTENSITKTTSSMYGDFYEMKKIKCEPIKPEIITLLNYVDDSQTKFIDDLREFVCIQSVSASIKHTSQVNKMINVVEKWMRTLGVKYECFDPGWHEVNRLTCKIPVIILGSLGNNPKKKTVCVYSYLDVSDDDVEEWDTDPWTVTEKGGKLFGKGVASGKGTLLCWFQAILAYQKHKMELPVNMNFIIESMYEQGSIKLEDLIRERKSKLFANVDYVVVCALEWLGPKKPCLLYGCTGTSRFRLTARQHEGSDIKSDLINIMKHIVNENDNILIPHFYDHVESITPAEEKLYDTIDFDIEEIRGASSPADTKSFDKVKFLMSFWRLPRINVYDIQECNCEKNDKTIMYQDFELIIVPKQKPQSINESVVSYVYDICQKIKCRSKIECTLMETYRPWIVNFKTPNFQAARKASMQIYNEDPNMIRSGNAMPLVLMLERVLERNIVVLPLASPDCNDRVSNENITLKNFFGGIKLLIAYLYQASVVDKN